MAQAAGGDVLSGLTPSVSQPLARACVSLESGRAGARRHCVPGLGLQWPTKLGEFVTQSLLRALDLPG